MDPRKPKWLVSALAGIVVTFLGRPLSNRFLMPVAQKCFKEARNLNA